MKNFFTPYADEKRNVFQERPFTEMFIGLVCVSLPMTEIVDVVDENDNIISQESLHSCLMIGLLHRAVGVFLRNSGNELFLQRRSLKDDYFPGSWTLSCTGHVKAGESCNEAAIRELDEELGLSGQNPAFLLKHKIPKIRYRDRVEYEIMYLYDCETSQKEIRLDYIEVEEGKYVSSDELRKELIDHAERFTPDAIVSFNKYFDTKRIYDPAWRADFRG